MKLYPFHKIGLLLLVLCSCNGNRSVLPFEKEGLGEISKINPPQPPLKLSPFVKGGGEHIQDQGDEQLTVNATTTDAEGTSSNDIQEANKLAEIFVLQKQLVYKLLQNIGITSDKLSPAVKIAINKPQTTNVKAFKAFCYCLDLMDKGQFKKAREQCDDAVKYDPNFALAQRLLESIPDHQETMPEIVANHMKSPIIVGLQPKPSEEIVLNTIPPVQLPSDIGAVDLQASEIDRSSPPCGNNGHCGFYSTFLAHSSPENGVTRHSAPSEQKNYLNCNATYLHMAYREYRRNIQKLQPGSFGPHSRHG
ncbi:hypothetical protein CRENPOLYSF2_3010005 [Crenothrix polyspora]|uniref:Uncharacterized protein n=1 Tax=Crenothrix polyspora TaxID=360316 RepID=A0A1R4H9R4_9GAMM|nr:hypothetical protein [Crenothrix polyspora]SJM92963.1 hypothetical protein CRENPOLYSF2_3010005 [Crenothrix polyspora]